MASDERPETNRQETGPDSGPVKQGSSGASGCSGCGTWFLWALACTAGTGLGWALGWRLSFAGPGYLGIWVIGLVTGAILGVCQALILRPFLKSSGRWVLATIFGWMLGFYLGAELAANLGLTELVFGVVTGGGVGLVLGMVQWLVLRTRFRGAGWWVLANTLAWLGGMMAYLPGANAMGLIYGAAAGILTGWVLMGLTAGVLAKE